VWLREDKCPIAFKVGECEFDHLIAVEWPDTPFVQHELKGKKLYPADTHGSELIRAAALADRPGVEFSAVLEGLIVTRLPLSMLVHPKSPKTPFGYGHLGIAPAMIVVKKVIEVKIIEKPSASPVR
jgi:hypothetical protein